MTPAQLTSPPSSRRRYPVTEVLRRYLEETSSRASVGKNPARRGGTAPASTIGARDLWDYLDDQAA